MVLCTDCTLALYCVVLRCTVVYSLGELTRDFLQVKPSELSECREDLWWLGHQNSQLFCDKNVPPVVLFDPSALHCACCYCSVTAGCWVVLIQYKLHSLTPWTSHLTPYTLYLTPYTTSHVTEPHRSAERWLTANLLNFVLYVLWG